MGTDDALLGDPTPRVEEEGGRSELEQRLDKIEAKLAALERRVAPAVPPTEVDGR